MAAASRGMRSGDDDESGDGGSEHSNEASATPGLA